MNGSPATTLELLALRQRMTRRVRGFFDARGFLEVSTPQLSSETFADRYLEPYRVTQFTDPTHPSLGATWYLQTSPELHMKRLLAEGATAIYQIAQAFRACELGPRHNPEFTLLEWYRAGDDYASGRAFLAEFLHDFLEVAPPAAEWTYGELFQRWLGVDPHSAPLPRLRSLADSQGIATTAMDRGDLLDALMAIAVEPHLAESGLVIIYDYPPHQAALARLRPDGEGIAERFEAYFRGVELANGYNELSDPDEFAERHRANNLARHAQGRGGFPEPPHFTKAMRRGLPPCVGVAMGLDRLLMAAAGGGTIDKFQTFPFEKA